MSLSRFTYPNEDQNGLTHLQMAVCLLVILLFGFYLQFTQAAQSDLAWLFHGARALYEGGNFLDDFYETNPPFNTVYYIPAVVIQDVTGLAAQHALVLYLVPQVLFLWYAIYAMARRVVWRNVPQDAAVYIPLLQGCLLIFVYFSLITTCEHLGQRDMMAGIGGYAAALAIYLNTRQDSPLPFIRWAAVICGTVLVLLKPHWGFLILAAFAHRGYVTRRMRFVFDRDFLVISLLCGLYLCLSLIAYPEYFVFVLPDVLGFYVPSIGIFYPEFLSDMFYFGVAPWLFCLFARDLSDHKAQIHLIVLFCVLADVSLIPAIVQAKGFMYHYIVACHFTAAAILMTAWLLIRRMVVFAGLHPAAVRRSAFGAMAVIFVACFVIQLRFADLPARYTNGPLHDIVHAYSHDPDDAYFIFFENNSTIFPTNLYIDRVYGSRFSTLWSLNALHRMKWRDDPAYPAARTKYARMFAEDLRRFKPRVVVVQTGLKHYLADAVLEVDMVRLFSEDQSFATQWAWYKKKDHRTVARDAYLKIIPEVDGDTNFTVDIYVRRGDL